MSNVIIVGAQWGDEGKGKIVDYLTEDADIVVRAQGGNNAGHTVINGADKYVLHLIPSGILWPGKLCVIGNGVVLDPVALLEEIDGLAQKGIPVDAGNLIISDRAHLVMPYHRELDATRESSLGSEKIGTTKRGIGPTYADKITRTGLRVADLFDAQSFRQKLESRVKEANLTLEAAGLDTIDADRVCEDYLAAAKRLGPHVVNTVAALHDAIASGKNILFEGAQGTYLDIDHGTFPYVTSSNTTSGGACTGSGVPPHCIDKVVAVGKAYTTRVGEGPFIVEDQAFSDRLHGMGREFGATTGRPRRCGWFDSVLVHYANMVNGTHELAITNLDGLDELESVKICTAYILDGKRLDYPPARNADWERCTPEYEELPGWQEDTTACRRYQELPANARAYLDRISELTGAPVSLIGVGPDREQTISR
ncbi:MAG: adenylosuccinate synthase [Verrucomicrobiales bacterium]